MDPTPPPTPPPTVTAPPTPTPPPPRAAPPVDPIFEAFTKLDLRVATVLECKPHANGDRLLVLQVELAGGERRQICAGIRAHYQPDQLVGKQVVIVANLAARQLRGEVSQGMILAASDPVTGKVVVLTPSEVVAPGSKVS